MSRRAARSHRADEGPRRRARSSRPRWRRSRRSRGRSCRRCRGRTLPRRGRPIARARGTTLARNGWRPVRPCCRSAPSGPRRVPAGGPLVQAEPPGLPSVRGQARAAGTPKPTGPSERAPRIAPPIGSFGPLARQERAVTTQRPQRSTRSQGQSVVSQRATASASGASRLDLSARTQDCTVTSHSSDAEGYR
jgi:hypothetical protein